MQKPNIQYPCTWPYTVIGSDPAGISNAMPVVLENFAYQFKESNKSKTGKFTSFHVLVHVQSEEERNSIFTSLKNVQSVKIVF